ncbi:MAG: pyroglutamyl-peptidase I [Candidatus Velthaea sp.]
MSKHVLLTGFEPFGDFKVNPSELLVRSLEGRMIAGRLVAVRVLPSETRALRDRLEAAILEEQPEFVIGTGLAAGRAALALERAALNVLDFPIPDAVGTQRKNDTIARGGPDARLASLPLDQIVESWHANGVPGYISNTAGTYLCNQWLYEGLALTTNSAPPTPVGFVHLPCLPGQANDAGAERMPSMALELMRKGIESLIETVITWIESRPASPAKATGQMWIPRGIREVER